MVGNQIKPRIHISTGILLDTSFEQGNWIETTEGWSHIG